MKKIVSLFVIATVMTACSSVIITGRKQLLLVSETDILSSSIQSYKEFIDSVPLSTNVANTAMIKKVGNSIAAKVNAYLIANNLAADTANYAWDFNLVKDTTVNAFCMPGGKVVFYEGILPITQNESGIAVVMGHEIAHAVAKHSNERMSQQLMLQYGASLTDIMLTNKPEATRTGVNAMYGLGAQFGLMLPYSRKHEYEADRLGLIFLAMAGYDPNEAISFWERMAANGSNPVEFMSTHPSDGNRIAKMKQCLPEAMSYLKK